MSSSIMLMSLWTCERKGKGRKKGGEWKGGGGGLFKYSTLSLTTIWRELICTVSMRRV